MTQALHRFSAAIFGWIPDVSGIPPRRQVTLGVVVSILLHLLAILLVALLIREEVAPPKISFAKPKVRARSIELTILPPEPEPEPMMPFTMAAPVQPFIDSLGLDLAREAALNPIFESDENMRAASERPASGDAPLPSQEGRDRPFNAFKTQKSLLGMASVPPSAPPPPAIVVPPAPKIVPPTPKTAENQEPAPAAPPKPKDALPEVMKPKEDEIALTAKSAPNAEKPLERAPATPKPVAAAATPRPIEEAKLTTPAPQPRTARESGYQPEQEQNRIEGSISNRGKRSVDSVATPMGKFKKRVNSIIGSRWTYYVQNPPQPGLYAFGTAQVTFYISRDGKIEDLRVLSNSANRSYAEMCLTAINDARRNDADSFRPPEGSLEAMRDGRLEYSLTFTYYSY